MASFSYESSRVFSDLKDIKERIPGNMTTYQYLATYDEMIINALSPIVLGTEFMDRFLLRTMGWQSKNFRRKVSFLPRPEVSSRVMTFLSSPKDRRLQSFKAIRLERGLLIEAATIFVRTLSEYESICKLEPSVVSKFSSMHEALFSKNETERELGSDGGLLSIIREVRYWLDIASKFKEKLLEKYVRLCIKTAQKDYVSYFDCSVNLDDLAQTYVLTASRAIDKCDYRQGVLTHHIQKWMFTARDNASRQRLISLEGVDPVSLTDLEDNPTFEPGYDNVNVIAELAGLIDPEGAARCFLQLPSLPVDENHDN